MLIFCCLNIFVEKLEVNLKVCFLKLLNVLLADRLKQQYRDIISNTDRRVFIARLNNTAQKYSAVHIFTTDQLNYY